MFGVAENRTKLARQIRGKGKIRGEGERNDTGEGNSEKDLLYELRSVYSG